MKEQVNMASNDRKVVLTDAKLKYCKIINEVKEEIRMTKVSSLLRYFLYYVAIYILVSMFIGGGIKPFVLYLCTGAIGISFIAALAGIFYNSNMLNRIEDLCLKAPFVTVGVIVLIQIAFGKIEPF